MALSLDDRLLGEKVDYYCSSSEDEHDDGDSGDEKEKAVGPQEPVEPPQLEKYSGHSTNVIMHQFSTLTRL